MSPRKAGSRDGWTRVRFGDVVRLSTERCTDPAAAGIDRYVGLEHLEPGDLRIRAWGNVTDGVTFTNRFRPGQVLFGKRRAYQRKVAVAEFDGICSSDIYVFEPADDRLLPELLPFICQADGFFDHALKTSAGSLSPRTNWTSLADYEFDLPSMMEQRRLVTVFQAADVAGSCYRAATQRLAQFRKAAINRAFAPDGSRPEREEIQNVQLADGYELVTADTLSSDLVTKGDTPRGEFRTEHGTIPFIKINNLTFDGVLDFTSNPSFISSDAHETKLARSKVAPGDVLMNLVGPPLGKIAMVTDEFPEWNINQAIARYRPRTAIEGRYLWYYLMSDWAQDWLHRRSKKTSGQRNLTLELSRSLPVPIPLDRSLIVEVVDRLDRISGLTDFIGARRIQLSAVSHALRKRGLGGDA